MASLEIVVPANILSIDVIAMSGFARVRGNAEKDRKIQFTALLHHVTPELLRQSFHQLKRQAAKGIDGVSWQDYQ